MQPDPYARFAEHYDRRWAGFTARTHAAVRAQLPASLAGKRLLDVGCGTGTLIASILATWPGVAAVTGIDASDSMLARAAAKLATTPQGGTVTLLEQPGDAPDLPPASFDIVLCANTFHYFTDPAGALRRLRTLLAPDGMLILEDYSKRGPLARYGEWAIRLYDPAHRRAHTLAEARRLVADAGLTVAHQEGFRIDLLWCGWLLTGLQPPAPRGTPETQSAPLPPGATHPLR